MGQAATVETPLLQTKLYIPPSQPNHISRSHLVQHINEGTGRKLTLIAAPAGFGKTSLLSQWIAQTDRAVAWISLDEGRQRYRPIFVLLYPGAAEAR